MRAKPKKVYLSVSYNTSASVIREVQNIFESYGVEVLKYTRGITYTPKKLLESDLVIGIPSDEGYYPRDIEGRVHISVGKGQYGEADVALNNLIPYYMLTKGFGEFSKFNAMNTMNFESWKKDYGIITTKEISYIEDLLGIIPGSRKRLLL